MAILHLGSQEPPDNPMIYNRRQPDGTFRSLAGFFLSEPSHESQGGDEMSESTKMRIPLREWRSKSWEKERERRLENLANEQRDTTSIAGKFANEMRWCALCGEELKFDSAQGWVHQDRKEGEDLCYCPTSTTRDWKAAERREEREKAERGPLGEEFGKLLGCLEDATYWLGKVNARFPEDDDEACDNPFWSECYERTKPLDHILADLNAVEKHMPKEVTA